MNKKIVNIGLYLFALGFISQVLILLSEMIAGFEVSGFNMRADLLNIVSFAMIMIGGIIIFIEYISPFFKDQSIKNNTSKVNKK